MPKSEGAIPLHVTTAALGALLRRRAKLWALLLALSAIDSLFLLYWAGLQYAVNEWVINRITPAGIEYGFLVALRCLFGIATLVPVLIYIFYDVRDFMQQAPRMLEQEWPMQ